MKYPQKSSWIAKVQCSREGYILQDFVQEETFLLSPVEFDLWKQLDGRRDPFSITPAMDAEKTADLLQWMQEENLIRYSRMLHFAWGSRCFALWFVRQTPRLRKAGQWLHALLQLLFLPVFIGGWYVFFRYPPVLCDAGAVAGALVGLAAGLLLHEAAHAAAALAYGGILTEVGVMQEKLILLGAYALIYDDHLEKWPRIRIRAAGVKANFLLAGCCLFASCVFSKLARAMFAAAVVNTVIGVLNACPAGSMDGMAIVSELLGLSDPAKDSAPVVFRAATRKKVLAHGAAGASVFGICLLLQLFRLLIPLAVLADIAVLVYLLL